MYNKNNFIFVFCLLFLILNFYWAVCFTWNLFFCCELFAVIKFSQGCRYFGNWYKNYGRKSIKKYMFSLVSIAYYVLHCSILYNRSSLYIVNFLRIWFLIKSNICEIDCISEIAKFCINIANSFSFQIFNNLIDLKIDRNLFYL